ncbi:MAG: hypothetical protein H6835_19590 [Planctomycetes bacterium]|nr:hypothetical protein [Planctomycetota bacterium]
MTPTRSAFAPLLLSFAAATAALSAQEGVPAPPGLVPEQMWYAPTAEDWAKPVQIRWQRTWDDAVRLSQATKKPILVCVNMDGEIASEHYAGVRYRDPEVGKLFEPYVCVIASVYRHNPRDYDDDGRRIPCPRLGCVTCGEHIAMEPIVFEKFLDQKRISPRHIMVELDGSETYDVFYTWDVKSVLTQLDDGIKQRKIQAPPVVKGDRSLQQRIQSPDSEDREAVEREFAAADREQRQRMLELALAEGKQVPLELLRMAQNGLDPALAKEARKGLVETADPLAIDLIADTLREPLAQDERGELIAALQRFGEQSTHARTLATAHQGLADGESVIDGQRWQSVLVGQSYAAAVPVDRAAEASARDAALADKPKDPDALLDVAESSLLQAFDVQPASARGAVRLLLRQRELLLEDAERRLAEARAAGADGWRPAALAAIAANLRGDKPKAYAAAIAAAPDLPPDAPGRLAVELLALFAEARQHAIIDAVQQKAKWPGEWTTDVHTAYSLLARHPLGRDVHVADHYDFLDFFRSPDTAAVLTRGLERFPASALLHERLRAQLLRHGGPDALENDYAQRLAAADAPATLPWFAGYASLVAAEQRRRRQQPEAAAASYTRALERFAAYRTATGQSDGTHYEGMAHAGLARLALQQGGLSECLAELQQVFAGPASAVAATDGLAITAMQTAEMLRAKASEAQREDLVTTLDAALRALPPEAFELPDYEKASRGAGQDRGAQRNGNRRRGG